MVSINWPKSVTLIAESEIISVYFQAEGFENGHAYNNLLQSTLYSLHFYLNHHSCSLAIFAFFKVSQNTTHWDVVVDRKRFKEFIY